MGGRRALFVRRILPAVVFLIALMAAVLLFTRVIHVRANAEVLSLAEEGVRRAAVECYALEGFYPRTLDYLVENYGVTAGDGRYIISYQYVASNLMPDITVLAPGNSASP